MRGYLREGYYGDLLVLKNFSPVYALINGEVALREGAFQHTLSGAVLKRK